MSGTPLTGVRSRDNSTTIGPIRPIVESNAAEPDVSGLVLLGVDEHELDVRLGGDLVVDEGPASDVSQTGALSSPLSMTTWSPGTTGLRIFTRSRLKSTAILPVCSSRWLGRSPPIWAMASSSRTPGMMGVPG